MIITELIGNNKIIDLVQLLHSSLDINTILKNFYDNLTSHLTISSLHYRCPKPNIEYQIGEPEQRSYDYNLTVDELHLGDICISNSTPLSNDEILLFEELLCLLVSPLKNAIMHQRALKAALHDPMTKLFNRSSFDESLGREIKLSKRHDRHLSVMEIDLDDFKIINDTYGHSAGDTVIKHFANKLKETIRNTDIAFRLGGEEFFVILCYTNIEGANILAQRLRQTIEDSPVITPHQSINYTISIGISSLIDIFDNQTLIENADKALYQAKACGKNQVKIHHS